MARLDDKAMFIKVENYEDILKTLNTVKSKLNEVTELFEKLNSLKQEEDAELNIWKDMLNDIREKVSQIDNVLFEAGEHNE